MSNNHAEPVEVPEIDDEGEESDDYDDIEEEEEEEAVGAEAYDEDDEDEDDAADDAGLTNQGSSLTALLLGGENGNEEDGEEDDDDEDDDDEDEDDEYNPEITGPVMSAVAANPTPSVGTKRARDELDGEEEDISGDYGEFEENSESVKKKARAAAEDE